MKDLCLLLKNGGDGIHGVACFKLLGEGMVNQSVPRLVFVVLESSVEKVLEGGWGWGGSTHIRNGRNIMVAKE
jgi:hypothetical protein